MLTRAVGVFSLSATNYAKDANSVLLLFSLVYIIFAIGYRYEIIIAGIVLALNLFVGLNVAYERPLSFQVGTIYIFLTFLCMLNATLVNIVLIYIGEVKKKLTVSNSSNINLLNGMHEGLLILSHTNLNEPSNFLYCNNSAQKLITTFVGPIEDCHNNKKSMEVQKKIMRRESFNLF